jgi:cystathionine beta-synthase
MGRTFDSILGAIGRTPLVRLNRLGEGLKATFYAKVEYMNPGGSAKDRIVLKMLEEAERRGTLKPGSTIIEATAGNTGLGLAMVAAIKGYRCIFVMPDKMSDDKVALLRAYGAEVVRTPTAVPPDSPESYNGVAERLAQEIPNSFRPNQFFNEDNPDAHYETTAPEIWEDLEGKIDVFVAGMGTGGTVTGVGRYFKEKNPDIKIIGADPEGSILSGDSPKPFLVEGIGEDFIPSTFDRQVVDEFIRVTDKESFNMGRRIAREEGLLVGGSSGTSMAAAIKYAERLTKPCNIVVFMPDTGRNYVNKMFNDQWLQENGLWDGETPERVEMGAVIAARQESREIVSVHPEDRLDRAFAEMHKYNISQVPVIDQSGRAVGSLREVTLMKLVHDGVDLGSKQASDYMARPLPEVDIRTEISEAYRLLLSGDSALTVIDNSKPVAIVSRIDLIDYFNSRK